MNVRWHLITNSIYLLSNPSLLNINDTTQPKPGLYKGIHNFPNCINLKVNLMARLEFELAYEEATAQNINLYTTESTPVQLFWHSSSLEGFPLCLSIDQIFIWSITCQ